MVECVAWAPASAVPQINEAAGGDNKHSAHQGPFLASGSRDKTIKVRRHAAPTARGGTREMREFWGTVVNALD